MGSKRQLDDHERDITRQLSLAVTMRLGLMTGGVIADGTLFWVRNNDGSQRASIERKSHGWLWRDRTYTATCDGHTGRPSNDVAYAAQDLVELLGLKDS